MERHLMMAAINDAAKRGEMFEGIDTLSHKDHDNQGGWEVVTAKFLGRVEVFSRITLIHMHNDESGEDYCVPMYLLTDESINRLYEQAEVYAEVRCDYYNEQNGWWCIDAWRSADDNEDGEVVGWVDGTSGNIYYKHEKAECSARVREVAEYRQTKVRKDREQKRGEEGETIVMLTAQVWDKVYPNMKEPDCTMLSCLIRDAAYQFEKEWYAKPLEERDGYYIDFVDEFAQKLIKQLTEDYCKE